MQKEKRQLSLEDFEIEHKLGKGAYGYVFRASRNCQEYAIKEMSKHQLTKHHCQHLPLVEKQVLKLVSHPGIVKSHFTFQTSSQLYLALEVCEGGSIEELVHKKMLNQQARRLYIAELVDILDYLHKNGIVHRDLKPSNVMLSKERHVKLIDFGTAFVQHSTLVSSNFKEKLAVFKGKGHNKQNQTAPDSKNKGERTHKRKSSFVGTSSYVSPQLLQFNECESPADLWALGCVVYFMYYGSAPFNDTCELQLYQRIKRARLSFPKNSEINEEACDLIKKLLVKNPSERLGSCSRQELSFAALKRHPYIAKFDFDNLFQTQSPKLLNQDSQLLQEIQQILLSQDAQGKAKLFSKMVIKHEEDKPDIICRIELKNDHLLEYNQFEGETRKRKMYRLRPDLQKKVANQLSQNRFSLGVQGSERLVFSSKDAKSICSYFNSCSSVDEK